jgi:hypothetical protein
MRLGISMSLLGTLIVLWAIANKISRGLFLLPRSNLLMEQYTRS